MFIFSIVKRALVALLDLQAWFSKDTARVRGSSLEIDYVYRGVKYRVLVPYHRAIPCTKDVYLCVGESRELFEQQTGVPILICPNDLRLDFIEVHDIVADTTTRYVGNDNIPSR